MPFTGSFAPSPRRLGSGENGHRQNLLQRVFESLAAGRGDAYDQGLATSVSAENMAYARAITFELHLGNQRLANQFNPQKTAALDGRGLLPRWERIFGKPMLYGDTEVARRARIVAAWAALVQSNAARAVADALTALLGTLFVKVNVESPSTALAWWPDHPHAVPSQVPWYSTIARLSIQLTVPQGYGGPNAPNAKWWQRVQQAWTTLDQMLPAWMTWCFWINSSAGVRQFKLDEHNLDLEAFGS